MKIIKIRDFKSEWNILKFVWLQARDNHLLIISTMLLQIVIGILPAAITYFVQDALSGNTIDIIKLLTSQNIIFGLVAILLVIFLKQIIGLAQGYSMANIKRNISQWYLCRISQLDYSIVHDNMNNRNVMAITKESDMLTSLVPMIYRSFISAPVTIIAFIILTLWVSTRLTLLVALLIVIVVVCSVSLRSLIKRNNKKLYDRFSDLHQNFAEWINGYRVFLLNGVLSYMDQRLDRVINDTCVLSKKLARIHCSQRMVVDSLTYCIVILFVIFYKTFDVDTNLQTIVSFPAAIMFIRNEALYIMNGYVQLTSTESATKRIFADLQTSSTLTRTERWKDTISQVCFESVSFGYASNINLLNNINMQFTANGLNVLTGSSGIGKTTCLDLLMGLRSPSKGKITYNGIDISSFTLESLHEHIALVEQEPFIFEGTLLENLTFGKPIPHSTVFSLCSKLNMNHIVPDIEHLNISIQAGGNNLSAGEKQRISFIRSLLKSPDVILLDEMTSSIDSETVWVMLKYLQSTASEKIVLCISHDERVIGQAKNLFILTNKGLYAERRV